VYLSGAALQIPHNLSLDILSIRLWSLQRLAYSLMNVMVIILRMRIVYGVKLRKKERETEKYPFFLCKIKDLLLL
jgi:hypothetical protein